MPSRIVRARPWDTSWPHIVAMRDDQYKNLVDLALERDDTETHFQIEEAGVEREEYLYVIRWQGWNGVCLDTWSEELSYWFVRNPTPLKGAPVSIPVDTHWGEPCFLPDALVSMDMLRRIVLHYLETGERAAFIPWRRLDFVARDKAWVKHPTGQPA